jgi:hypothetical protein
VELVTLKLEQDFLKQFSVKSNNVVIGHIHPSTASTLAQLSVAPASGPMGDDEVMVLETTFAQVFGAIVSAIEGDTEVMDAQFLHQDIFNEEDDDDEDDEEHAGEETAHDDDHQVETVNPDDGSEMGKDDPQHEARVF